MNKQTINKVEKKSYRNARKAYFSFITQTFFKRPFGYIVSLLFIVYLAVILLIVPKVAHLNPLFIWSNAAFNVPIFNLFFISASASAMAVAIYRTGRDDGTDLSLSAKPLTKGMQVGIKTGVYLLMMFVLNILTVAVLALIKPIYGEYNLITNITGITDDKYKALLFSVMIGNTITTLFFGGISVLISLVGGQVATMVTSIGIAFIMCLMNVVFPIAVSSPRDVLNNKYNTSINSYSANTLNQFNDKNANTQKTFAAIQCITQEDGVEISHFDTEEYWRKANASAGTYATNYVDFGKQLSYLYSAFGLDSTKLVEASKLNIGANISNNYKINKETHVIDKKNLDNQEYPISIYSLNTRQGVSFPIVHMLAGNMGLAEDNWFASSTKMQADFNSCFVVSTSDDSLTAGGLRKRELFKEKFPKNWFRMSDLVVTDEQWVVINGIFNDLLDFEGLTEKECDTKISKYSKDCFQEDSVAYLIANDKSGVFFDPSKTYIDLPTQDKAEICSKVALGLLIMARQTQLDEIKQYCSNKGIEDQFPYTSKTIKQWYFDRVKSPTDERGEFYNTQKIIERTTTHGVWITYTETPIGGIERESPAYAYPINSQMDYCETYNNLYQYKVTSFYNVYVLIAVWGLISIALFSSAIIVYKKIDFK